MTDDATWLAALGKAENALLAAWIAGPAFRERWTPVANEFSDLRTRALAAACAAVAARGAAAVPGAQVVEELARSGALGKLWPVGSNVLPELPSRDPDGDLGRWGELRIRFALRQRLVELVSAMGTTSDLSAAREALLDAIRSSSGAERATTYSLSEGLGMAYHGATEPRERGTSSGFPELDRVTGGTRPGHVWAIGAPTNWGKSSLLLALADHHVMNSRGVLLVTCEDAPELLFTRWLSRRANIHGLRLRDGRMQHDELGRATDAIASAGDTREPVMLDGRGRRVEHLARDIAAHVANSGIQLVLVDYLQAITTERTTQDRRAEINHIGRTLTDAIKGSGAAGILASQLTGEDLRESRDIEHAAEVVLIGRKDDEGKRSLLVKKNKTGPNDCTVPLGWNSETGAFYSEEESQYDYGIPDAGF